MGSVGSLEQEGLFGIIGRVLKLLAGQSAMNFVNILGDWEVFRELILKPPPHQDVTTSQFSIFLHDREGFRGIIERVVKFLAGQGATDFANIHGEWEGFRVMRELILKPPPHQDVLTF